MGSVLGFGYCCGGHGGCGCYVGGLKEGSISVLLYWTGFCCAVLSELWFRVSLQVIAVRAGGLFNGLLGGFGPCI